MWSSNVDEHRRYLSDMTRMEAFEAAIRDVVRAGDVVLDMGTGTGILGLLACRAGARRVYSIDRGPIIELARKICAANGFQDRVVFLKGLSTRIDLPEKVDVVVADQLDCAGFEAGLISYFADAKARFLKPGGRMIPAAIDFRLAAVQCDEHWQDVAFWERSHAGFKFSPASDLATNVAYAVTHSAVNLISSEATGQSIEFANDIPRKLNFDVRLHAERPGVLHGLACWFSARLAPAVVLTNAPRAEKRTERRCTFLPIANPVEVRAGDEIHCTVQAPVSQQLVHWTVAVRGSGAREQDPARFVHSTFKGALLSPEDLAKTAPGYRPHINSEAHALLTALRLMDEGLSVGAIQSRLRSEHPNLFRSDEDCGAFVAEVVRKHSI